MQKIKLIVLILLSVTFIHKRLLAQNHDCINGSCFINPLNLPLSLSAGFGEVRPGHFHAGLDIRTNQKTGFDVKAIADGYVARILVKIGGYGNAIYIKHPNGYISIYAHLKDFNKYISNYVRKEQYKRKKFAIDLYLQPNTISVKQGDIIALSGNTGSSGGPHLHFEIRDKKKSYLAVNPLVLGYNTKDTIAPTITKLIVYKADEETNIDSNSENYKLINILPDSTQKNLFKLDLTQTINVNGPISLGIACFDMPNTSSLKTSPYSIDLLVDDKKTFSVKFDKMSYYLQKMANTYLDYGLYIKNKLVVHKSFLDKGNILDNYKNIVNKGVLNFTDNKIHKIKYIVKDFANNTSILKFNIFNDKHLPKIKKTKKEGIFLAYNKAHKIENDDIIISFSKNSFFNDVWFTHSKNNAPDSALSDLYTIGDEHIPLNKGYKLSIKPTKTLLHPDKALIVNSKGASMGGHYKNGFVTATIGKFGSFYISEDTLAPTITPWSINHRGEANDPNSISFKISDNLSGIKSFNGYINDNWVLFEYEPKTRIISYYFDEYMPKSGPAKLKLIVDDNKNNKNTYEQILTR